jgi:hypothetical protein
MILDCEDEGMWYKWRDIWNDLGGDLHRLPPMDAVSRRLTLFE